jgi:uncharacterized protein (DUF1697 family)
MPATHIALLRGVNVGGRRKVSMAALRTIVEALGHQQVSTYVQSGNVVFTSEGDDPALASQLEQAVLDHFGFEVSVFVRAERDWAVVAVQHPFAADEDDHAKLHVLFLATQPDRNAVDRLDPARFAPDRFVLNGHELYVHYPNGAGRSKLTLDAVERALDTAATGRNWRTVVKLLELARAID